MSLPSLRPTPHVIAIRTDDGIVLADPLGGYVRALNEVGALVWEWVTQNIPPADMAQRLAQRFVVTPEQAAADIEALLRELQAKGLLEGV